MASIRKKPGSVNWFACFRIPTGKTTASGHPIFRRVQRSTGTTDETRAAAMAVAFDRAAVVAGERQWSRTARKRLTAELDAIARGPLVDCGIAYGAHAEQRGSDQAEFMFSAGAGLPPSVGSPTIARRMKSHP